MSIQILCLVEGDDFIQNIFDVNVSKNESIRALKRAIKEAKTNDLAHVDADKLELWKADIPFGTEPKIQDLPTTNKLLAIRQIVDYWPKEMPPNCINILIALPPPGK